jgi:hypothetical protein
MPKEIEWIEVEPQWLMSPAGSIRGPKSYRKDGWIFMPSWLPDDTQYDIGSFKTRKEAIAHAIAEWSAIGPSPLR